ncbi:putative major facilitator superfamily transporter [Arthrobacter globiformis NBRC 12137]|uniref:Putative proline/betaine transporter n=1 Tax=Arthrobacter globiformis (strain ATCC 8010 / DSM 20124 / JCM 1332 / NBRC 12137 / NCIMB 8907 / NRRL B-2979 / 168) TaxID=1077972 RepID=H0QTC2_ARTG1|nr:MFS transporter [Arthrobacter globiformis]GAB16073.1 putative major facilitator superfamily transporter [Arthrobacter globiformis NBRC 12137]
MSQTAPTSMEAPPNRARRAVVGAGVGTFVEYYDFIIYGFMAAAISHEFFPTGDPMASLLLTFGAFLASYLIRPLGAVILAPLSDKYGRRPVLAAVILLMTLATAGIGLLPTYSQIGVWAPILLTVMRLLQGLSAGGEYGSAASMVAEFAPAQRRGFYLGFMTLAIGMGMLGGSVVATLCTKVMPSDIFESWGWRIPFLVALPVGLIGLYIRSKIEETPHFQELAAQGQIKKTPLATAFRRDRKNLLIGVGLAGVQTLSLGVFAVYATSYLTVVQGFNSGDSQIVALIGLSTFCVVTVPLGLAVDRFSRRTLLLFTSGAIAIWFVPAFMMFKSGSLALAILAVVIALVLASLNMTAAATALMEMFATDTRTTGASVGWQVATSLFGGPTPLIMTALVATGIVLLPAVYGAVIALLCLVFVLFSRDAGQKELKVSGDQ